MPLAMGVELFREVTDVGSIRISLQRKWKIVEARTILVPRPILQRTSGRERPTHMCVRRHRTKPVGIFKRKGSDGSVDKILRPFKENKKPVLADFTGYHISPEA